MSEQSLFRRSAPYKSDQQHHEKTSKRLVFFATIGNRIGDAIADFCI